MSGNRRIVATENREVIQELREIKSDLKEGKFKIISRNTEIKDPHPAVIISNDIQNLKSNRITVVPFTHTLKPFYESWEVHSNFNNQKGKIMCDQVKNIDKNRIIKHLGTLDPKTLKEAERKILDGLELINSLANEQLLMELNIQEYINGLVNKSRVFYLDLNNDPKQTKQLEGEITDLKDFSNLKGINASNNDFTNLNFLDTLPNKDKLVSLNLFGNQIKEIDFAELFTKFLKLEKTKPTPEEITRKKEYVRFLNTQIYKLTSKQKFLNKQLDKLAVQLKDYHKEKNGKVIKRELIMYFMVSLPKTKLYAAPYNTKTKTQTKPGQTRLLLHGHGTPSAPQSLSPSGLHSQKKNYDYLCFTGQTD
ncbi:10056_t:CDS:2 [Diversispora eburnea]|uniref:10056_t:CDS:1 n=1 Tax=Diversispora eburnea TaxID=1213867 RepID=A0A9N9B9K2_9GLOM|nr:10056_t:CDS:2 [Diversispora eburnea]